MSYVEAATALGYSHLRIALRHVLPNVLAPVLVYGTLQTGRNVILAASLSFLGLGPQPPTPDWGQMLSGGRISLVDVRAGDSRIDAAPSSDSLYDVRESRRSRAPDADHRDHTG